MGEGGEDRVAIRARWRRLRNSVEGVRDAVSAVGADENVRDAVAFALDALYDMAEAVKHKGGFTNRTLEDVVAGDVGGETTLGLLWARGEKTHALVDFGDLHTFGSHGYGEGPYGGGWAWQRADQDERFPVRSAWYASRVRGHRVLDPFDVAVGWLKNRPEISLT